MNHYKEIAEDYTKIVDSFGFKDSQQIAPIEFLNDENFIQFLPLRIKETSEFKRLQRIYK